ncbi:MAG TPA: molybdenum cofactor biosynthesis protein [Gammaproteobacteria bacterium]|jgi:molybdopterin adenylyltransferase|uniref:molybdenum cofactor synthesis domain-containing protein n=1 Tax=Immundisolibacter sp. TaxID=1934948 RepID=UPI000E8A2C0C|nr:molybdenum cofactor biosynthesis protein [Gammaproteobacteria bacterium]HCZ48831.1 molybdenum cofactor biosynthesis protein [Gammaproteobacteria bacterium]MCH78269.1 molybdenum cofactor biosynthesis protein [Gammaproteobacteria bacterium]
MSKPSDTPRSLRVAVLTYSNRRTVADDTSGDLIRACLAGAGHRVVDSAIRHGDASAMREFLRVWVRDPGIDAVICTGGTGITDCMPEAAASLIEHDIPGFATLFQMLSLQDIGSSGMLSRAQAGLAAGKLLFLLPGSENGCRLAMQQLVVPQLDSTTRPCSLAGLLADE